MFLLLGVDNGILMSWLPTGALRNLQHVCIFYSIIILFFYLAKKKIIINKNLLVVVSLLVVHPRTLTLLFLWTVST